MILENHVVALARGISARLRGIARAYCTLKRVRSETCFELAMNVIAQELSDDSISYVI